jgi:hypothetical protein
MTDARFGELGLDPGRVGVGLVDLVERDDRSGPWRLRVADRLERLRHHAVIGSDHDDRDVRDARAAGTHGRERLVARCVQEHDALPVVVDLRCTDVLGDATTLAGGDLGRTERVEQAGLAVVDVAHDRDDRGARFELLGIVLLEEDLLRRLRRCAVTVGLGAGAVGRGCDGLCHLVAELRGDKRRGVTVDELVDRREDAALDQFADDVRDVDRSRSASSLTGDGAGQLDRARSRGSTTWTWVGEIDRFDAWHGGARVAAGGRSLSVPTGPPWGCTWGSLAIDVRKERRGERGSRAPAECALVDGFGQAVSVHLAEYAPRPARRPFG